ncbi:MAG: ferrous iron transport protein A [Anaerolineales bacterium]|nr:ferrous iron transport protein A [Anaerolineales bacterium]
MTNNNRFWQNRFHPRNNPIEPDHNSNVVRLGQLENGQKAKIIDFQGGPGFISRMAILGFIPGTELEMIQNYGRGPIIVSVRGTHVALGRRESWHIRVNKPTS